MPDRRITDDMVTRALEVLHSAPPGQLADEDLARRALEDALLAPGAAALVTEYANPHGSGWKLWDTGPFIGKFSPLAERIEAARGNGDRVLRRTVIVVDDWEEVTEP